MGSSNNDILGRGWTFPLEFDKRGGISLSGSGNEIEESIRLVIRTAKHERRMRPDFGCDIHTLVFAPNNATTWGLASRYVEEALNKWEPRIQVLNVDARPDSEDTARLLINIYYRIKAINDTRNLVFPFYLMGRA
jgi:uncharacterized protein